MNSNKLILLFKSLSEQELRELKQFVRSPFFNQRKDVIQLFDVLRKENLEKLREENLYNKTFTKSDFDKKELAYVMNYLIKVIEKYFAYQEFNQSKTQQEFFIAKAALRHGQENIFQQKIKKAKLHLEKDGVDNLITRHLQFQIDMELYNHDKNRKRDASLNLEKPTEHLDVFIIASKLKQACSLLAHENLSKISYQHDLLNHILNYLESPAQKNLLKIPLIGLYYYSYKTLKEEKSEYFQELKKLLQLHNNSFTENDLEDFYSIGLNFCIKQLNQGKRKYVREAFEWYRTALEKKVFFEHGKLSQFHYKNIAALGIGLKEFDWVESFLKTYKVYLEKENQEQHFNYNLAKLHYEKKEYEIAMQLLQSVKFNNSLPNLTSKILLMKIYFELDEREVLSSYLNSFERVVRRQRKLGYHKESYLNLISAMRKLLSINIYDKKSQEKLKEFILEKKVLPERNWLLLQLEK